MLFSTYLQVIYPGIGQDHVTNIYTDHTYLNMIFPSCTLYYHFYQLRK